MKRHFLRYWRSKSQTAQFLRFATVGVKISLIDIGGLYLLKLVFGVNPYLARLVSITLAMVAGYILNRYFTFNGFAKGCFYRQLLKHLGVHAVGGVLNFGVYSAVVAGGHAWLDKGLLLTLLPIVGVFLGGVVGMTFNFYLSQHFVFQTRKPRPKSKPNYSLETLSQVDSSS